MYGSHDGRAWLPKAKNHSKMVPGVGQKVAICEQAAAHALAAMRENARSLPVLRDSASHDDDGVLRASPVATFTQPIQRSYRSSESLAYDAFELDR